MTEIVPLPLFQNCVSIHAVYVCLPAVWPFLNVFHVNFLVSCHPDGVLQWFLIIPMIICCQSIFYTVCGSQQVQYTSISINCMKIANRSFTDWWRLAGKLNKEMRLRMFKISVLFQIAIFKKCLFNDCARGKTGSNKIQIIWNISFIRIDWYPRSSGRLWWSWRTV